MYVVARRLTEVDTAALREAPAFECANDLSRSALCINSLLKSVRVVPGISAVLPVRWRQEQVNHRYMLMVNTDG